MKKLLFLLLITAASYGQTYQNPTFGTITTKTAPVSLLDPYVTTMSATGVQGKVAPENIPLTIIPPTTHYSPATATLKGHLQGIDNALGNIVATTAGNTTRVWFTGDPTVITAGTFYSTNATSKGTVASAIQSVVNDDNQKKYFNQDLIGNAFATTTIFPPGVYAGNLSASTTPNSAQQRYTVELYKCDTNGTPIASGVSGAPVGSLGVTVIIILDSGLVTLADGSVTNLPVSANLGSALTVNVGERIRYHVSAEKVGTTAANITESVYYGTSYNSYLDVPTPITSSGVSNVSTVTGATVTIALDNLNIGKENTSNKQNSLSIDGTGVKFPTVDAVNSIFTTSDKTNQNIFIGFKKSSDDALNNYEFSMARMSDGTLVRAGIYSTSRTEQAIGAYVGFSKSIDDGKTWSSVTTIYTSVGETVELPTIGVVGTRIVVLFRTTTGGVNTYTNGTAKTAYSDNAGASWTIGSNIVSPASVILLPYGRIDQHGDGKYIAMLHNQNYCEAWETTDGATWTYRSTIYDYRSAPIGGTAVLIEPNCIYIGSNKSIIVARNSAQPTTGAMQFISSNNLGTVTLSGTTNLNDGVSTSLRAHNPVALLSDNIRRILYASTSTRTYDLDSKTPNTNMVFISDLDAVFASPTAYVLKHINENPIGNANTYNKGYNSLVFTSTGILGMFTNTTLNYKETIANLGNSKIDNSYQYSLFLTGSPYDFKNIVDYYQNSKQVKNINTGNYDYITDFKTFEIDAEGLSQGRNNTPWIFANNTQDNNTPIALFTGLNSGYRKYFEIYRNRVLTNYPLFVNSNIFINTTDDSSGSLLQIGGDLRANFGKFTGPATVSGESGILRAFSPDGPSLIASGFMSGSVTQYMLLKATSSKPLSFGTTGSINAFYINNDGGIKMGSASASSSWLDLQASTTAHGSILIPTGIAPTTPVSGAIWRPSASVLNFYDGTTSQQFAFLASPALTGTPTAPTATAGTNTTQIATTAFVQTATSASRPYLVYTALISQSGTSAPTATVLENTLGGTVVWTRSGVGQYVGTLSGVFTSAKTFVLTGNTGGNTGNYYGGSSPTTSTISVTSNNNLGSPADTILAGAPIEIRVYN